MATEPGPSSELDYEADFRCYGASEIPTPYQVFYFSPELYAIICAVPIIPMELAIPGIVSGGGV